jgi:hypothetical protein
VPPSEGATHYPRSPFSLQTKDVCVLMLLLRRSMAFSLLSNISYEKNKNDILAHFR